MPRYAARWKELGIQLKLSTDCLDTIAINNNNHPRWGQQCCMEVLQRWMEVTTKPTWDIVKNAIDHLPDCSPNLPHERSSKSKQYY